MIKFNFIKNSQLTDSEIQNICTLKSEHWPYNLESQKAWMSENFTENDIHLVLYKEEILIGYLSLKLFKMKDSLDKDISALGLGSVCVKQSEKGKNFGLLLMYLANFYLHSEYVMGVLLCKKELVAFYQKCGWKLFDGTITFNSHAYSSYLLTTKEIESESLCLPFLF